MGCEAARMHTRALRSTWFALVLLSLSATACAESVSVGPLGSDPPTSDAGADAEDPALRFEPPPDAPLPGACLLMTQDIAPGARAEVFTPAGEFVLDRAGHLTDARGVLLVGYAVDDAGVRSTTRAPLVAPTFFPARASTKLTLAVNLSASSVAPTWDPLNPSGTSNFSAAVTVYDSLGGRHNMNVYFVRTAPGSWDWHAMVDGGEATGGTSGVPLEGASGTLSFTTAGELATEVTTASSWNFAGATPGQSLTFDFGTSIAEGGTGLDGSTQFASPSTTSGLSTNGRPAASLVELRLTAGGELTALSANHEVAVVGWVALVRLWTSRGLRARGASVWIPSADPASYTSGPPSASPLADRVGCAFDHLAIHDGIRFDLSATFDGG